MKFTDIAAQDEVFAGFQHTSGGFGERWMPECMGAGCAFIDYDNDDRPDVLLVAGGEWEESGREPLGALRLFHNNGDGTFRETTESAGLADIQAYGFGLTVADFDNDGDQDFYFTAVGKNMLFRNDNAEFVEVGESAGVAGQFAWSTSAMFFDADNDGWPDLFTGNYVLWTPETDMWCSLDGKSKICCTPELYDGDQSRFYHNNGDGTFSDFTTRAGFDGSPGKTLGVAMCDIDLDGWTDVLLANDTQPDQFYHNNGDGTFTDKGTISGMAFDEHGKARGGMGIDAGVIDDSGLESVLVANFSKEMLGVYKPIGNGMFMDRAAVVGLGLPSLMKLTFAMFLFDVDLDGDLDLFLGNGHIHKNIDYWGSVSYAQSPQIFINKGVGKFIDGSEFLNHEFLQPIVARGAAYADFDGDGDLDILLTENDGPAHLWRNDSPRLGQRIRIKLTGRECNQDAIGARLVATVGDRKMYARVRTGSSYLASSEKKITFGLGNQTQLDSLQIFWPGGKQDIFENLAAGFLYSVTEKKGIEQRAALK